MGCLSKDKILASNDIKMEKVFVPEWADGDPEAYVMVKALTSAEQDAFDATVFKTGSDPRKTKMDLKNYRAKRAAFCMCDDEGNLLFASADIPDLAKKSSKALQRVLDADRKLNGDVEELEKNLEVTLEDSLLSDSPEN